MLTLRGKNALLGAGALLSALGTQVQARLLVNDTFDTPGATRFDDPTDPGDLSYYAFTGGSSLSIETKDQNSYLKVGAAPAFARYASSTFERVTLANVGDSITLGFDISATRPGGAELTGFNIGLYDSTGSSPTDDSAESRSHAANDVGYMLGLLDATSFYNSVVRQDFFGETMSNLEGGGFIGVTPFGNPGFHRMEFTITRNAVGVELDITFDGTVLLADGVQFGSTALSYDNLQFSFADRTADVFLDNITVSTNVVPEPASAGLVAGAGLALLGRRRRPGRA